MTAHDPHIGAPDAANPGGAIVADLRSMDGERALAVMMFRDSFAGPEGTARIRALLVEAMGAVPGAAAFETWSALLHGLAAHARRPLMRHALRCTCVGADEAVFAQVLDLAARGEREDAMLTLALLVPGDRLPILMMDAERAGLAVMRAARHYRRMAPPDPPIPARKLH